MKNSDPHNHSHHEKLLIVPFCVFPQAKDLIPWKKDYRTEICYFNPDCSAKCENDAQTGYWRKLSEESGIPLLLWPSHFTNLPVLDHMIQQERTGILPCEECFALRITQSMFYASTKHFRSIVFVISNQHADKKESIDSMMQYVLQQYELELLPTLFVDDAFCLP